MLLGATLLPVADVLSSEDLEKSTSFSCPNESETTDEGDLSVIPDLKAEGWGLLSSSWHDLNGYLGISSCDQRRNEIIYSDQTVYTLE